MLSKIRQKIILLKQNITIPEFIIMVICDIIICVDIYIFINTENLDSRMMCLIFGVLYLLLNVVMVIKIFVRNQNKLFALKNNNYDCKCREGYLYEEWLNLDEENYTNEEEEGEL